MILLRDIAFPVYVLTSGKPQTDDGVSFYIRQIDGQDTISVLDDKSIEGDSLALRRLSLLSMADEGLVKLSKLNKAIFFLGDFIKLATSTTWFIDSKGTVFNHKKTKMAILTSHEITKTLKIVGGWVVEAKGVPCRFKTLYLEPEATHAGVMLLDSGYILYGLYDKPFKKTWRRV